MYEYRCKFIDWDLFSKKYAELMEENSVHVHKLFDKDLDKFFRTANEEIKKIEDSVHVEKKKSLVALRKDILSELFDKIREIIVNKKENIQNSVAITF